MMFSAKLFTIVAAVLAVAVNGSPIGGANPGVTPSNPNGSSTKNLGGQSKTDPNHVCHPRGPLDVDGGEM